MCLEYNSLYNDYVIDYRIRAAALMRASYFRGDPGDFRASQLSSRARDESVAVPASSVPVSLVGCRKKCVRAYDRNAGWGWLRGVHESVQIGPNDDAARPRKSESSRGDQFAGERERASERTSGRARSGEEASLDTRGEIDFERET